MKESHVLGYFTDTIDGHEKNIVLKLKQGSGSPNDSFLTDLAEAHVAAADYLIRTNEDLIVNLGSETGLSVREIVETARRVTGKPIPSIDAPRRAGDPAKLVASSALAHEKLGWTAKRSDAQTLIESTWKVYKANFDV